MQPNVKNNGAAIRSARVLIVDEDFTTRKLIRTLLLSLGVTDVHDAGDGESGLASVAAFDPDVVILDWQMAGMHGAEFVRRVRSPDGSASFNVPIVMLTGHGEQSRVIEAMRLGVHEFLVKPVSGEALRQRLASVLRNPRPAGKRGAHGPQVDRPVANMVVVD
jgi:two-component system, chemotaxis family, chemotaxis protein CheY